MFIYQYPFGITYFGFPSDIPVNVYWGNLVYANPVYWENLVYANPYPLVVPPSEAHEGEKFVRKATAYGREATGGSSNAYNKKLVPGMIAIGKKRELFKKLFPNGALSPNLKYFELPDGTVTKGVKVRIDRAKSPYDPLLQGLNTLKKIKENTRLAKETSFEAVVCDFGSDIAFRDDHIDIYYDLLDTKETENLAPLSDHDVELTVLNQDNPIIRPKP